MKIQDKEIAIIGGGPGGLTLARLLQQDACRVKVYERDQSRDTRIQGANLDLHEASGLAALKKAGLLDAFYANYLPGAGKLRVMDHKGIIYMDDHKEGPLSEHRPEIDRGPLRRILLDSLKPGTVVWDRHFVSMEKENEGWQIRFRNGKNVYADLVIAADGANSRVRTYLTDIKPVYSGITIVEGTICEAGVYVPNISSLLKGGKIFALGNGQSIILSTKGDGSITFYTGEKVAENWVQESGIDFGNPEAVKRWFDTEFAGWSVIYQELFATGSMHIVPRPQYYYEAGQEWVSQSNLTLLGDVAHRMPPYAGEGVNMAMLDALELSKALLGNENIPEAIRFYEKAMRSRADEITAMTMRNTIAFHEHNGLETILNMFRTFAQQ